MCKKWGIKGSQFELRLCKSAADIVQLDPKNLTRYNKHSDVQINDLLANQGELNKNIQEAVTLYLLYDIKAEVRLSDGDFNSESESGDQSGDQSSEESKREEESKKSEDGDEDMVDIFTDILSLLVLKKRERMVMIPARVKTQHSNLMAKQQGNFVMDYY